MKNLLLVFFCSLLFAGCKWEPEYDVTFSGTLQQQGITFYMYGSHVIGDGTTFYALRSSTIDLDDYLGEVVTIEGNLVEGYPIDFGPDYIEVVEVED